MWMRLDVQYTDKTIGLHFLNFELPPIAAGV